MHRRNCKLQQCSDGTESRGPASSLLRVTDNWRRAQCRHHSESAFPRGNTAPLFPQVESTSLLESAALCRARPDPVQMPQNPKSERRSGSNGRPVRVSHPLEVRTKNRLWKDDETANVHPASVFADAPRRPSRCRTEKPARVSGKERLDAIVLVPQAQG
jgi:hypothetical protein